MAFFIDVGFASLVGSAVGGSGVGTMGVGVAVGYAVGAGVSVAGGSGVGTMGVSVVVGFGVGNGVAVGGGDVQASVKPKIKITINTRMGKPPCG